MKRKSFSPRGLLAACLLVLVSTGMTRADVFPPVAAPLVTEGVFAVRLAAELGINQGLNIPAAVNNLSSIGIVPRGGWVPEAIVTPALIAELQSSIFLAARSGQLLISGNRVLRRFNNARIALGLPIFPVPFAARAAFLNAGAINPAQINRFFANNGPPLLTFFNPPMQFRNLFTFTPCPFVCSNIFFPGFFLRNDIGSRSFIRISNFGRVTPALIARDNARGFRSIRFSTDALLTARLRSPNFSTTCRPGAFVRPSSIQLDRALRFNSVRFSTDGSLVRGLLRTFPVKQAGFIGRSGVPFRSIGAPRPVAKPGFVGRGRPGLSKRR